MVVENGQLSVSIKFLRWLGRLHRVQRSLRDVSRFVLRSVGDSRVFWWFQVRFSGFHVHFRAFSVVGFKGLQRGHRKVLEGRPR